MNRLILTFACLIFTACPETPVEDLPLSIPPSSVESAETPAPLQNPKKVQRVVAKPRLRQNAQPPSVGIDLDINDDGTRHRASVRAGFEGNVGIDIDINETTSKRPVRQRRRPSGRTCKSALLANGHSPSSLIHCDDDTNQRCAVALLNAGHSPASLVHCGDIEDAGCAVALLRRGDSPSSIVHCD